MLVNAARGGIVDEDALYDALKEGRVAGAGLDVFAKEPCTDSPLFELENVVATPHLGASTDEAQEKAGIAVARSVRLALAGELVPDAVNVQGGVDRRGRPPGHPAHREARPDLHRARRRGRPAARRRGARRDHRSTTSRCSSWPRSRASSPTSSRSQVSYVNAPLLAAERGVEVRLVTDAGEPRPPQPDHPARHPRRRLAGLGLRHPDRHRTRRERLVEVNGFDVDLEPTDHLAFFTYEDRPGMVGTVGGILGEAGVNIAGMQVARDAKGGQALVALSRRLGDPGRDARRDRGRHRRRLGARRRPGLTESASDQADHRPAPAARRGCRAGLRRGGPPRSHAAARPVDGLARARRRRRVQGIRTKRSRPPSAANTGPGATITPRRSASAATRGAERPRAARTTAPARRSGTPEAPRRAARSRTRRDEARRAARAAAPGGAASTGAGVGRAAGPAPAARSPAPRGRGRPGPAVSRSIVGERGADPAQPQAAPEGLARAADRDRVGGVRRERARHRRWPVAARAPGGPRRRRRPCGCGAARAA